jgi:thioesterase domain-containing protein
MSVSRPLEGMEQALTRLWERVLEAESLGPDADFFEVGGDSLSALVLTAELEKLVGHRLAPSVLAAAPSPALMAELLRRSRIATCWSDTVVLRAGADRPPLFVLPGRGGAMSSLCHLAHAVEAGVPVLGLPYDGPDGMHRAPESLEALATALLPTIEATQPTGPCQLLGYSFGGRVAFELARQLGARGRSVHLLGLLDTWGPGYPRILPPVHRIARHWQAARERGPAGACRYLSSKAGSVLMRAVRSALHMTRVEEEPGLPEWERRLVAINKRLAHEYHPQPYDGHLTLFRAEDRGDWLSADFGDRMQGWGPLASGGVTVCPVPGNHGTIVSEPHAPFLAAALNPFLA